MVSETAGPGRVVLSSSLAEISNINNVYLVYDTLQTYITAMYLVLHWLEIYYVILRKCVE
jgi:hypothetical protein